VVSFNPRPLYPRGKSPGYPLDKRLRGFQSRFGSDGEEKETHHCPWSYNQYLKSITTELSGIHNQPTNQPTNHTEQSPSAGQEIPRLLRNTKVHYLVHKGPKLVPNLSHMHPVHKFSPCFPKIHSNISLYVLPGLPSGVFSAAFPTEIMYAFFYLESLLHSPPTSTTSILSP
jgi:hypothetical protein